MDNEFMDFDQTPQLTLDPFGAGAATAKEEPAKEETKEEKATEATETKADSEVKA